MRNMILHRFKWKMNEPLVYKKQNLYTGRTDLFLEKKIGKM